MGAHDGGPAADVATRVDGHSYADTTFDHRRAERARVEGDESFRRYKGAGSKVRPKYDPIGIRDLNVRRRNVVEHGGKRYGPPDFERACFPSMNPPERFDLAGQARALRGPNHLWQHCKDTVEIRPARPDKTMTEQMKAKVNIVNILR